MILRTTNVTTYYIVFIYHLEFHFYVIGKDPFVIFIVALWSHINWHNDNTDVCTSRSFCKWLKICNFIPGFVNTMPCHSLDNSIITHSRYSAPWSSTKSKPGYMQNVNNLEIKGWIWSGSLWGKWGPGKGVCYNPGWLQKLWSNVVYFFSCS